MTESEEKSLKTQVDLYGDIQTADNMIIYQVQSNAKILLEILRSKMHFKDKQKFAELTKKELEALFNGINNLSSDEGFCRLNEWINAKYIEPKNIKLKILDMLK